MVVIPEQVKICVKHILTGIDGETYDVARVCWVLGTVFYMAMTIYNCVYKGQTFDYVNWGIGFSSVMAAAGVSIKLKENSEPKA